jgi:hypothetical protein
MRVKITIVFDTDGWAEGYASMLAAAKRGETTRGCRASSGFHDGIWMIVDEKEVMDRLASIHGLGHKSEIEYLGEG